VLGALVLLVVAGGAAGCDRIDPPAPVQPTEAERAAEGARGAARQALTKTLAAAQAVTASCVAGELIWEADPDGNTVARHFSRPCLPERCTPAGGEIEALRAGAKAARALVDAERALQVPSYQGVVALAEAMVGFADTAVAGTDTPKTAKDRPARMSGLSMHYGALVAAYRALYPEAQVAEEPAALTASLAEATPGGDPCKGWAIPKYCDVKAVRVPKERRWRSAPPCLEVEAVKR
jgi:hypothetical protein